MSTTLVHDVAKPLPSDRGHRLDWAMRMFPTLMLAFVCSAGLSTNAFAQRFPFERSFDVGEPSMLDVSTNRGKIEISVGEPGRIVVNGNVTVRIGSALPADAIELARNCRIRQRPH